ncbi:regulatory protein GemA [Pseudovibrio exalbescens]|uniref:regulatory protein GemA n=1 Tax=Pseudovibrio exalbescens TaxID=197461 RepID=UPI0023660A51|nr:regulatory protein GemA [Pseudovibrio exalbescens]MDD7908542.1 regulatory protein GemA [Pseudovibrio exalbescens]
MSTPHKRLYAAKKAANLDDDTLRDCLQASIGRRSAKGLTMVECDKVLDHIKVKGHNAETRGVTQISGVFGKKAVALWLSAWNLGIVQDRSDRALLAWVKRQTKIDHINWVDGEDGSKVIDALKGWISRSAGVDWRTDQSLPSVYNRPEFKVFCAQVALLKSREVMASHESLANITLTIVGEDNLHTLKGKDWIVIMNTLGRKVRACLVREAH